MPAIADDATRVDFTIASTNFSIAEPYKEGHVVTAGEASALNQLLRENTRNNLAKTIKEAAEGKPATETEAAVEPKTQEELQAIVDDYVKDYQFGVRAAGTPRMDPEEREARSIVTQALKDQLKGQGKKPSDFAEGEFDKLADQAYVANKEAAHERAKAVIAARTLNLGTLGG